MIFRVGLVILGLLFGGNLLAKTCNLTIYGTDMMSFTSDKAGKTKAATLEVPAGCTDVKLTLTHNGKLPKAAMGHNWVLSKTSDLQAVSSAGIKAGLAGNYVPKGDKRVLASTGLVGGRSGRHQNRYDNF